MDAILQACVRQLYEQAGLPNHFKAGLPNFLFLGIKFLSAAWLLIRNACSFLLKGQGRKNVGMGPTLSGTPKDKAKKKLVFN